MQQYIDPVSGAGEGQAPVGAVVTVAPAAGKNISISAKVTLASGYALQAVNQGFQVMLEKYRKEKAFQQPISVSLSSGHYCLLLKELRITQS